MPHGKLGLFLWCGAPQQLWLENFDHLAVTQTWTMHFKIWWEWTGWAAVSKQYQMCSFKNACTPTQQCIWPRWVNEKWGLSNWTYCSTDKRITRMMAQINQQKKNRSAPGEIRTLFPLRGTVYQVWPSIIQSTLKKSYDKNILGTTVQIFKDGMHWGFTKWIKKFPSKLWGPSP